MRTSTVNHFLKAKREGRLCKHCGWIVTKKDWAKGHKTCANCRDALRGVNVKTGAMPYRDEPKEKTGES